MQANLPHIKLVAGVPASLLDEELDSPNLHYCILVGGGRSDRGRGGRFSSSGG